MSPRRFVITNTVALNGGDAAILVAIARLLLQRFGPGTQIDVFDSQAAVAQRYLPELRFHPHLSLTKAGRLPPGRLRRYAHRKRLLSAAAGPLALLAAASLPAETRRGLHCWRSADAIISTGGTYLTEKYSLWGRLLDFDLAERLRQTLVLYTQSVGAFRNDARGKQVGRVFKRAKLALLRDERSLQHVRDFSNADCAHWHVQPDVAFSLADTEVLSAAASRTWPREGAHVVISVREWDGFSGRSTNEGQRLYRDSIAQLTTQLVSQHNARVTFLSTCQGIPEYWTDDSREAERIAGQLSQAVRSRVDVDREHHHPLLLMKAIAGADLVVATRLHMAILALCAGTPVLPIGYEHKTAEVFKQLGQSEHVLDINSIAPELAVAEFEQFLSWLPTQRGDLFRAVERLRAGAADSVELLARAIDEPCAVATA